MNAKTIERIAHQAWWISGLSLVALSNGLLVATSRTPFFHARNPSLTLPEALRQVNKGMPIIALISSATLFFLLRGDSPRRPQRLLLTSSVAALLMGTGITLAGGHLLGALDWVMALPFFYALGFVVLALGWTHLAGAGAR